MTPKDPYKYFRVEARELHEAMGRAVLLLEKGGGSASVVSTLLRQAHTLKGAARVVKQGPIAEHAHAIEGLLVPYRDNEGTLRAEHATTLLEHLDGIGRAIEALKAASSPKGERGGHGAEIAPSRPPVNGTPLRGGSPDSQTSKMGAVSPLHGPTRKTSRREMVPITGEAFETVRVDIDDAEKLLNGLTEAGTLLGGVSSQLEAFEQARYLVDAIAEQLTRWTGTEATQEHGHRARALALSAQLAKIIDHTKGRLARGIDRLEGEMREARERANTLRLVPASALFGPLERIARDVASSLHKDVEFQASGGDIRIDGQVLSALRGALLHIVRNAVDHAIEPPAERQRLGKPRTGQIRLRAERIGSRVCFTCEDDGAGIDAEAVHRAAVARGLVTIEESASLSAEQTLRLIFRGGLSTRRDLTDISGRGIGLDAVEETVRQLHGDVQVRSIPGRGTTFALSVPLSLSSMNALVIEAKDNVVALPLDAVRKVERIASADVRTGSDRQTILFEGNLIPFVAVEYLLGGPGGTPAARNLETAIIVHSGGELAAVGVARVRGTKEIVVRALPSTAIAATYIAGASLDDEGHPQLVLDARGLVDAASKSTVHARPLSEPQRPPVLVIDDSMTTRMLEQSILESAGYDVDVASSAEEALGKATARRYGLFLCDVEMPGMSGFEFAAHTRASASLASIPIILVTSLSGAADRKRGQEVGAAAYMVKSEFDQGALLGTIRELIG